MSNTVKKLSNLYNEEFKNLFLLEYHNPSTVQFYRNVLRNFADSEEYFEKDLAKFTTEEVVDSLKGMGISTQKSLEKNISIVNKYKDFAVLNGIIEFNDFSKTIYREELGDLVSKIHLKNQYFNSYEEFIEVFGDNVNPIIINAQDRVAGILLYNGIMGEELTELRSIKKEDINFEDNTIRIIRNGNEVYINIPAEHMKVVRDALEEKEYYSDNGMCDNIKAVLNLNQNDYLIRGARQCTNIEVNKNIIFRRIKMIGNIIEKPLLNTGRIYKSGLFHKIQKVEDYLGRGLEIKEFEDVIEDFGVDRVRVYYIKDEYNNWKEMLKELKNKG